MGTRPPNPGREPGTRREPTTHAPPARRPFAGAALAVAALLALGALAGCGGTRQPDPRYRPAENVLEVVAVLRRHVPDDTYRFEPARDFTGKNVYRASLLRLENLERIHGPALIAAGLGDVVAFAKGRALERLRAFELAAASYRRAAASEGPLRRPALRAAALCDALAEAARIGFDAENPGAETVPAVPASDEGALEAYDTRVALLEALLADAEDTHFEAVVREEIERADVRRARHFTGVRHESADGNVRALSELQRVALEHRESKNRNRHLLALADFYETLAVEYVETHPPESLVFDPATFAELADSTVRVYEIVAREDGTPEKLEASRRLEAFLAFTLRIDRDRFSR